MKLIQLLYISTPQSNGKVQKLKDLLISIILIAYWALNSPTIQIGATTNALLQMITGYRL